MYSPLFCWQTSMLWPVHSLGKAVSLCPALFCTERPNLPAIPGISFFFLFKIIFYSSIVNSQCFRYTADWFSYNIYIHTHIYIYVCMCILLLCSHSVMSSSLWPRGLKPARLLFPWDFPGKNMGVGCHTLLHPDISLDFLLSHSHPLWWKGLLFFWC